MTKLIDGELHTRESIVRQYENLVYKNARSLCRSDYDHYMHDLAQEGFIGLLDAFDRYNPDSGFVFVTYAYKYVRGYMLRYHDKTNVVRVPHTVIRLAWQIERNDMWGWSDEEIAKEVDQTITMITRARIYFAARHYTSIDKATNDEGELTLHDMMSYEQDLSSVLITDIANKLNPREREIVYKLYQGYLQSEIAPELGISKARVGHIVKAIRAKLQKEGVK